MPVGGLVLNNVRNKKYELKRDNIENTLKIKILGEIPYDKRIPESIARRKPVVLFKPNSKSGRAFKNLAAILVGETPKEDWFKKTRLW